MGVASLGGVDCEALAADHGRRVFLLAHRDGMEAERDVEVDVAPLGGRGFTPLAVMLLAGDLTRPHVSGVRVEVALEAFTVAGEELVWGHVYVFKLQLFCFEKFKSWF